MKLAAKLKRKNISEIELTYIFFDPRQGSRKELLIFSVRVRVRIRGAFLEA